MAHSALTLQLLMGSAAHGKSVLVLLVSEKTLRQRCGYESSIWEDIPGSTVKGSRSKTEKGGKPWKQVRAFWRTVTHRPEWSSTEEQRSWGH